MFLTAARKLVRCLFAIAFAMAASTEVVAFTIEIDPGAYEGQYNPAGQGTRSGPTTVDLSTGIYQVSIAPSSSFSFVVDVNGDVGTVTPASAAHGAGSTLFFDTTVISVNPGSYTGTYSVRGVDNTPASATRNFTLMPGLNYILDIAPGTGFNFVVDGSGAVTTINPASAAQGNGTALEFNTTTISVEPGAYTGVYSMRGVDNSPASEHRNFTLLPGLNYILDIAPSNDFRFLVDGAGDVTSVNPPSAAQGNGSSLEFNTTAISVDPAAYTGTYSIKSVDDSIASGTRSFILLPGLTRYIFAIAPSNDFRFDVDGTGNVVTATDAADGLGNTLALNTTDILVDPRSYTGTYSIRGVDPNPAAGVRSFTLMPGVTRYILDLAPGVNSRFDVASPCAINPAALEVGNFTFDMSCGRPDGDGDGVPDDTDNCPSTPNPDQLDLDLDGLGDACDADRDGDGLDNLADNCPDFENADQTDSDGDGLGNACEADDDDDGVLDDVDNCPLTSNPDQADSDVDGTGDACDPDDDDDSIIDEFDNCPLTPNFDQLDGDGDGAGDVCDEDGDGDGVANENDLCPSSPLDRAINADGCTGGQLIALECQQESYAQHGQYVSCVAHAANDAVEQGLLAPKEKAQFVKEAAQSK